MSNALGKVPILYTACFIRLTIDHNSNYIRALFNPDEVTRLTRKIVLLSLFGISVKKSPLESIVYASEN